ncbi:MAG: alpha/beta fold hydrolase [Anaerolineales bacterium]
MPDKSKISDRPSAIEFGSSGPLLHFAHANGYPPRAYTPLLELLATRYHVIAQPAQPLWPNSQPNGLHDWTTFADDLIAELSTRADGPVIGVGHSLGGVTTLMAALRQPELFHAIVLIDPVIFIRPFLWLWRVVKALGLGKRLHPLIPGALKRRRVFASAEEMFTRYRRAEVFSRMDDAALRVYVDSLAAPRTDGQVELNYSPEWEVAIYYFGPPDLWTEMPRLRVPMLLIYGAQSDTFSPRALADMQRALPNADYHRIEDAGHLVPLEKPNEVGQVILTFLNKVTG